MEGNIAPVMGRALVQRVLVTGGAGFIGAHLVRALVRRGHAVRVLDDMSAGTAENLSRALDVPLPAVREALGTARARWVRLADGCEARIGDVRDTATAADAAGGVHAILHQAALRSVSRSLADPLRTHEVNMTGTLNVLEAARQAGVRRVVVASSSSVYGDTDLPKHEGQLPQPKSPYGAAKLAAEAYCQAYARAFGLSTIALRYFNVFGPWQDPSSEYAAVIPKFIRLAMQGEPLPVHGDGEQSRDFTYVENVVDANLAAMDADASAIALNIGTGTRCTLRALIEQIGHILGRSVECTYGPSRPGDVQHSEADITLAARTIGYVPRVDMAAGLRRTIESMQPAPTRM